MCVFLLLIWNIIIPKGSKDLSSVDDNTQSEQISRGVQLNAPANIISDLEFSQR
jgi:hypothetical protein